MNHFYTRFFIAAYFNVFDFVADLRKDGCCYKQEEEQGFVHDQMPV